MKLLEIGLGVLLALAISLLGKVGCSNMELQDANDALNKQLMQADLELGRAHTEFGNANKYVGELEEAIQEEIKERNAEATRFAKFRADVKLLNKEHRVIEKVVYKDKKIYVGKDLGLEPGHVYRATAVDALDEMVIIPFRYEDDVLFMIHDTHFHEGQILSTLQYETRFLIQGTLVETITPSGAVNQYLTIKAVNREGNEISKLPLKDFHTIVNDQREKQLRWAPHLDIGVASTLQQRVNTGVSAGISLWGHGKTKNDLTFRFPRVSLDYDGNLRVGLSPVLMNIGNSIPLLSNVWVAPHVNTSLDGKLRLGLFLGAVL